MQDCKLMMGPLASKQARKPRMGLMMKVNGCVQIENGVSTPLNGRRFANGFKIRVANDVMFRRVVWSNKNAYSCWLYEQDYGDESSTGLCPSNSEQ